MFIYFASLLGGFLFGVTETINKNITEQKFSAYAYAFIQNSANFLLYLIPGFFVFRLPYQNNTYLIIATAVLCVLFANVLMIKAYKTEDISSIHIISRISLIVSFLSGVWLLKEPVNIYKLIALSLIIVGVIIIFYEGKRIKPTKGMLLALISGVSWGAVAYLDKLILFDLDPVSYMVLMQGSMAFILGLFPQTRRDVSLIVKKYKWKVIASRFTAVASIFLYLVSVRSGNISVVTTNFETIFLLTTVLVGIVILKEKKRIVNKVMGSGLCVLGIVLLNFL